jgi:hypothetical protein
MPFFIHFTAEAISWSKRLVLWLIVNCAVCNSFKVDKTQMSGSQLKYTKFLFEITNYWARRQMQDGKDAMHVKRRWRVPTS